MSTTKIAFVDAVFTLVEQDERVGGAGIHHVGVLVVDSPLASAVAPAETAYPVVDRTTAQTLDANAFVVDAVAVVRWAVEDFGFIACMFV